MKPLFLLLLCSALATGTPALAKNDYRIGERLKAPAKSARTAAYRTITWDDLLPKGWDPMAAFKGLDLNKLDDADPRAIEAMARIRKAWDEAPVNNAMHGAAIRIPGFLVSLDGGPNAIREFLLVPYFGACIHVPPPPANQIIHVLPDRPVKGVRTMDPVWASGVLEVVRSETPMGKAGYVLKATSVVPYKE